MRKRGVDPTKLTTKPICATPVSMWAVLDVERTRSKGAEPMGWWLL